MTDNLGAILEYVDALRALDTTSVEPMTARRAVRLPDARRCDSRRCRSTRRSRTRPGATAASSRFHESFPAGGGFGGGGS
jgi:Asp-tRNA(Asn)/Glu-tRNA(Gln) amidotransferase C subunit